MTLQRTAADLLPGDVVSDFWTRHMTATVVRVRPHSCQPETVVVDLAEHDPLVLPEHTTLELATLGWQSIAQALWATHLEQPEGGLANALLDIIGNTPCNTNRDADLTELANTLRTAAYRLEGATSPLSSAVAVAAYQQALEEQQQANDDLLQASHDLLEALAKQPDTLDIHSRALLSTYRKLEALLEQPANAATRQSLSSALDDAAKTFADHVTGRSHA